MWRAAVRRPCALRRAQFSSVSASFEETRSVAIPVLNEEFGKRVKNEDDPAKLKSTFESVLPELSRLSKVSKLSNFEVIPLRRFFEHPLASASQREILIALLVENQSAFFSTGEGLIFAKAVLATHPDIVYPIVIERMDDLFKSSFGIVLVRDALSPPGASREQIHEGVEAFTSHFSKPGALSAKNVVPAVAPMVRWLTSRIDPSDIDSLISFTVDNLADFADIPAIWCFFSGCYKRGTREQQEILKNWLIANGAEKWEGNEVQLKVLQGMLSDEAEESPSEESRAEESSSEEPPAEAQAPSESALVSSLHEVLLVGRDQEGEGGSTPPPPPPPPPIWSSRSWSGSKH